MKVGRPPKYEDEETRKNSRRIQNRDNQRKRRLKKKILEELKSFNLSPWEKDKRYKKNLVDYLKQFDFDYFFTGTTDPDYIERKKLKLLNDEIKQLNHTLNIDLSYQTEKRVGISSLRKYTENYINFLSFNQLITRCFVVFEFGKNNKFHVHIMFKVKDGIKGFEKFSEDHWLMGTSITEPIETEHDKFKTLSYCVKELRPSSHKIHDLNKIDNWFLGGYYETDNQHEKVEKRLTPSPKSEVFYFRL